MVPTHPLARKSCKFCLRVCWFGKATFENSNSSKRVLVPSSRTRRGVVFVLVQPCCVVHFSSTVNFIIKCQNLNKGIVENRTVSTAASFWLHDGGDGETVQRTLGERVRKTQREVEREGEGRE